MAAAASVGSGAGAGAEEEPPLPLDRTSRTTRGKRMTKLLDEEIEQDEQFWNQEALKEEENDDNYEEEPEAADVFDSDFDDDESEADEEGENDVHERLPIKKRLMFPGKTLRKKAPQKKVKIENVSKIDNSPNEAGTSGQPEEPEAEKVIRKSTRTSVIVRQAEREAIQAEMQATMKPIKRKKESTEKRITQEEMLLEAAETEIMNLRNLERVLAREEEVKKKAIVHKAVYDGPRIRFSSKDGTSCLQFLKGASFGSELGTSSVPYPKKSVCVITGLPAKYRDPKTGLPYATIEAFKKIRERFASEELARRRPKFSEETGELFGVFLKEGCVPKKRRTESESPSSSAKKRVGARFRRIPALYLSDED